MPTFAGRPSTLSSTILVEFPMNSMFEQQRQQISEMQFDKVLIRNLFSVENSTCSDYPSEAMLWIKEVEMVDSSDELRSSR